jgi:hypothetical protein
MREYIESLERSLGLLRKMGREHVGPGEEFTALLQGATAIELQIADCKLSLEKMKRAMARFESVTDTAD